MAVCYRHKDRETGVSCSNCGNPICPDCMTPTPVGMRCPECSRQKTQVKTMRSMTVEPTVAYVLIAINVVAFAWQMTKEGLTAACEYGAIPARIAASAATWANMAISSRAHTTPPRAASSA